MSNKVNAVSIFICGYCTSVAMNYASLSNWTNAGLFLISGLLFASVFPVIIKKLSKVNN